MEEIQKVIVAIDEEKKAKENYKRKWSRKRKAKAIETDMENRSSDEEGEGIVPQGVLEYRSI